MQKPDQSEREFPAEQEKRSVAVALDYQKGDLPKVVAIGRGAIAEKILEIAFANGVKVRQDRDLAELLAAVELNCPIPVQCFEAVAEILRYLYQANAHPGGILAPQAGVSSDPNGPGPG